MRVAVAAWTGSGNAGDELVHAGLLTHLRALDVEVVTPARAALVAATATRAVDGCVLGGGGLLQDSTSVANLPYHLAPVLLGRVPAVGVALGAGPLTSAAGRRLVRRALGRLDALTVRDAGSATVLGGLGGAVPTVTADLAFALPSPAVPAGDVLAVALRPWAGRRYRLPVALRRPTTPDPAHVGRLAAAVDAATARTGLSAVFVVLDRDKDTAIATAVADRLRAAARVVVPDPLDVPAAVGAARAVLSMRYHGGVAAALAGRPAVLLGYDPKVGGLAGDLDARVLDWRVPEPDLVAAAVVDAVARPPDRLQDDLDRLRRREAGNRAPLEALLAAAGHR